MTSTEAAGAGVAGDKVDDMADDGDEVGDEVGDEREGGMDRGVRAGGTVDAQDVVDDIQSLLQSM